MARQISNRASFSADAVVEEYGRCYYLYPAEKALVQRYVPLQATVLDLGCGAGRTTIILHEMGYRVIGADYSIPMVRHMFRRFPYLTGIVADASMLPFRPESFDAVLFSFNGIDSLYPLEQRQQALRSIFRVLRPGGHFIFSSHNPRGMVGNAFDRRLRSISERLRYLMRLGMDGYVEEGTHGGLYLHYSPLKSLKAELEACGFEWVETRDRNLRLDPKWISWLDPWPYHVFAKGKHG